MKEVLKLDPKNANALNYIGYNYADKDINLDEAERLIKKALEIKPEDGYITDSLGWVYYKKGEIDEAIKKLEKAIKLVPKDPIIAEHLGDAYLKNSKKDRALAMYEKALKLDPNKKSLKEKIKMIKESK